MPKQGSTYHPRPGTKVAIALEAIHQRPLTARELSTLLACTCNATRAMLLRPLSHGVIIKIADASGQVRYARPKASHQTRFKQATQSPRCERKMRAMASEENTTTSSQLRAADTRSLDTHSKKRRDVRTNAAPPSQSGEIASVVLNGEFLTIVANGKTIQLDSSQRNQLYSCLHKLQDTQ